MKKAINTEGILNELQGGSSFFKKDNQPQNNTEVVAVEEKVEKSVEESEPNDRTDKPNGYIERDGEKKVTSKSLLNELKTGVQDDGKPPTERYSFEIYTLQKQQIEDLQYLYRKKTGKKISSSRILREALDNYLKAAFKILDKTKTETHYNSKWLKKLGFTEISKLADLFSVHEFNSRELIKKRLDAGKRVSQRETLYPLMQGYDSVAVKADLELGGTDQRFNLLAGRTIQPAYKQAPQDIMTMQLLEGTDGRKMSSSWGNVINITDNPDDMFGKVMSISDELIKKYFILATRVPLKEIDHIIKTFSNPRDQKIALADEIIKLYYPKDDNALKARDRFIAQFSNKELPTDIKEVSIKPGKYSLIDLLAQTKLVESKSEARRLIAQNGVKVNGEPPKDELLEIKQKNNLLLQVGKRKFIKVK